MSDSNQYPLKDECYKVIGCCMEVHKELGCGFLEAVYQEALAIEFDENQIPYQREQELDVFYKGKKLNKKYNADFLCYNELIVELKAMENFTVEHTAQVLNYLKATNFRVGLLVNFGTTKLQHKRIIY